MILSRTRLLIVLLLLGVGVFITFLIPHTNEIVVADLKTASVAPTTTPTTLPPVPLDGNMLRYRNEFYRFTLDYPEGLAVTEYAEQNGGRTVTFEATSTKRGGFQIFIIPYKDQQVSEARFKLDVPSGVMQEPIDVLIGGVRGTMFWSQNSVMGETREVWFIRDGFLYEVTTYKALDAWLSVIMQTWKFQP